LATPHAQVEVPGPVGAEHFAVAQDVLFAFDKSALDDMLPDGRAELDRISEQVKTAYRKLTLITIIGHADRIGNDTHNQELSLSRAQTVRDYLLSRGQPSHPIVATGVGSVDSVANGCPAVRNSEVKGCVQPDRRVTIDVLGEKRR
jgi:outer membrane protein OmpA-like peptidoglycan-associated protein